MNEQKLDSLDLEMFEDLVIPTPRMSEPRFRTEFLPWFCLDPIPEEHEKGLLELLNKKATRKLTKEHLPAIVMSKWIDYVGSTTSECHVVDENDNILFTVPSAYIDIPPLTDTRNLDRILITAHRQAEILPKMGDRIFDERLTPLINKAKLDPERLRAWNVVFDYYGKSRYNIPGEDKPTQTATVDEGDNLDDLFG